MMSLNNLIKTMPKAYSYVRFSTPEQAKGDSLRRQLERSKKYAEEHNLVLDTSLDLLDQGLSGFTGENRRKGALGMFLKAVESGLVPEGSFLIVESIDRLSRDKLLEQIGLFTTLINAGITVVTLDTRQELNRDAINADPMLLMISIIGMYRSHDESAHKSDRVRAAWSAKRKKIAEKKLTSVCPGWLRLLPDRKGFEIIPERAALIQRMFEMNANGTGQMTIARIFNQEQIPVWGRGRGWHMSFIQRILHTRTVLGEFQPCSWNGKESVPDGPPILDYYPAIIPLELWQSVQRNSKPIPPGRKGPRVSNLFSGLIYDGYTGTSMRHISRRAGSGQYRLSGRYYYLVSDYARLTTENKGQISSWRYDWFESLFLKHIVRLDWRQVAQEAAPLEEAKLRSQFETQQAKVQDYQQQLKRLTDIVSQTDQAAPKIIMARISELERMEATAQEQLLAIAKAAAAYESRRSVMQESGDKIKELVQNGTPEARLRLREEIRRKIDRIDLYAKGVPDSLMKELPVSAPGWPTIKITFANGACRWIINKTKKPDGDAALLDELLDGEVPEIGEDENPIDAREDLQLPNGEQVA